MPNDAARHYTGDRGRQYHQTKRGIPAEAFHWISRLRTRKLAPYVASSDVVFEHGVGSGWNLAGLTCRRKLGFDVADFLEPVIRDHGIEFLRPESIQESSVDVALCHHSLEHILDPAAVLSEMRRLLRPGGKLLLFVPFEHERRYRQFNRTEPNHHLYSWNVQTLGNLVEELGFQVIEAKTGRFGYERFAAVWANRLRTGEAGFRMVHRILHALKPALEVCVVALKP